MTTQNREQFPISLIQQIRLTSEVITISQTDCSAQKCINFLQIKSPVRIIYTVFKKNETCIMFNILYSCKSVAMTFST